MQELDLANDPGLAPATILEICEQLWADTGLACVTTLRPRPALQVVARFSRTPNVVACWSVAPAFRVCWYQ